MRLWYAQPAERFEEALPIGNGRLGGMVYGRADRERLSLNEDTFWSGYPKRHTVPGAPEALAGARALAAQRQYAKAQRRLEEGFLSEFCESYLAFGSLWLQLGHRSPTHYCRELLLEEGIARVSYQQDGVAYTREYLCSYPDQVLAVRLAASRPGALGFTLWADSALPHRLRIAEGGLLQMEVEAPGYVKPRYGSSTEQEPWAVTFSEEPKRMGMTGLLLLQVVTDGEVCTRSTRVQELEICDATEAVLYLSLGTSFAGFDRHPRLEGRDYAPLARRRLGQAVQKGWPALLQSHRADHRALFGRASLTLGPPSPLPTDQRLARYQEEPSDSDLCALLFQYGRYLLIASSRPGSQPMNLQGVWNEDIRPIWSCNYTTNINLQMCYWPVHSAGLGELDEPLLRFIAEAAQTGARAARDFYGAEGWVLHHNSDLWRMSTPCGAGRPGMALSCFWNGAGGWLCRHLWEHYQYTGDRAFLREVYPLLAGAVRFYLAVQVEEGGEVFLSPATSPENHFLWEGERCCVAQSAAMSVSILRDLYTLFGKASALLGVEDALTRRAAESLRKLRPAAVGPDGRLLEWEQPFDEADPHHRHLSHLYGLYPGEEIDPEQTPELAQAAARSLQRRGDGGTGWSLGWKICLWARLGQGDRALALLDRQLRLVQATAAANDGGGSYPNLFSACPPLQMDGNLGALAGICGMLLYSREGLVHLLPALPARWREGSVAGLQAKGGLTVGIQWAAGRLVRAQLAASRDVAFTLRWGEESRRLSLRAGEAYRL